MARLQSFARDVQLATAGLAPQAIASALAAFARSELSKAIQSGEGSAEYDKYVSGVFGADESTVRDPLVIVYDFRWWREIIEFALQTLVQNSPRKSGRFEGSWVVLVDGIPVGNWADIGLNSTVMLVNTQPYARKIDTGFMATVGYLGVDRARRAVMGIFGNVIKATGTMVELPNGPAPAPYILKGRFKRGIRPFSRTKLRPDTKAGAVMKYPALKLEMRTA